MNRREQCISNLAYNIVFYTSVSRDLRYLAALMLSVVEHFKKPAYPSFHLLHSGLQPEELDRLTESVCSQACRLYLHPVDELLADRVEAEGFGYWGWLWAVEVLSDLDRVLYLDCDMLCYRDITELWATDLGETFGAVVLDPGGRLHKCSAALSRSAPSFGLEFCQSKPYFNGGFFFMNLRVWREQKLLSSIEDAFHGCYDQLRFHDQDALNLLLQDKVLYLSPCWNLLESVTLYQNWDFEIYRDFGEPIEYFQPIIRHFSGNMKPDGENARFSQRQQFYHYLDQTSWRGWRAANSERLLVTLKAKLLDFHYIVTRGLIQRALHKPWSELAQLTVRYPYLPFLYCFLPLYRFSLRLRSRGFSD